jgi:hypothetical protein
MRSGSGQPPPRGRYGGNRPAQQGQRTPQRGQSFDSNGPNIKIRGSAHQIFERYVALAREAAIGDDRVAAENYYQHAEHYFRIANAGRDGNQPVVAPTDAAMRQDERPASETDSDGSQPGWGDDRPGFV